MKNLTKRVKQASLIVTIAVIAALAFSCAPPVEISDFDWNSANAADDPAQNSSYTHSAFAPTASITSIKYTTATNTISEILVDITFPQSADVLRGEITAASLGFITFHTFTTSTTDFTADTLGAAIPFTLEKRAGETVTVKLTTSINTDNKYSSLIFRVDGKKYTYNHGQKLDIDDNGKIESPYDDQYTEELYIGGSGSVDEDTGYTGPGSLAEMGLYFESLPSITTVATAPATPADNVFFFTGTGTTTNSNTLLVVKISQSPFDDDTTNAEKAAYKDMGDTLAKGIKLQKLNGTTWTNAGNAEYDDAAPAGNPTSWDTYIVIKGVTFDHLATYRLIWTGSAPTESAGTYYGAKVRLYLKESQFATPARPLNRTEVIGGTRTPVNTSLTSFIPSGSFSTYVTPTLYAYDSEGKNVVLRVLLNSYYWKSAPALADFKKSFQIVYSLNGTPGNGASDLVYVDVNKIEYKAEGSAIVGGVEKGKNVLYITLDPKFVYDPNAAAAHQNWLTSTYNPWEAANNAYQQYQSALQQYQSAFQQYNQARTQAQTQFNVDLATWQDNCDAWLADNDNNPDSDKTEDDYITEASDPKPVLQDYYDAVESLNPGTAPSDPGNPGPQPTYTGPKGIDLYFRVNDGISISDNASPTENVRVFGSASNFAYDFFEFYPVF